MKFSIIVPIYNTEDYLNKCLESINNQCFRDFEVILVDDGSKDKSPELCDEYIKQHHRFRVIHQNNGGVTSARKAGAKIAMGEYIVCVDSDDWISDTYLSEMYIVIQNSHPDMIVGGWMLDNGDYVDKVKHTVEGFETGMYNKDKINKKIIPVLLENGGGYSFPGAIAGKAYKRELFQQAIASLPNEVTIGEDAALNSVCVFNAATLYVSEACTYNYRTNLQSATRSRRVYSMKEPSLIAEYLSRNMDLMRGNLKGQIYRSTVHKLFNRCVSQFYRNDPYSVIIGDLDKHLSNKFYIECVENSDYKAFKFWKGFLAQFALKHRMYKAMYLYSKLK